MWLSRISSNQYQHTKILPDSRLHISHIIMWRFWCLFKRVMPVVGEKNVEAALYIPIPQPYFNITTRELTGGQFYYPLFIGTR